MDVEYLNAGEAAGHVAAAHRLLDELGIDYAYSRREVDACSDDYPNVLVRFELSPWRLTYGMVARLVAFCADGGLGAEGRAWPGFDFAAERRDHDGYVPVLTISYRD